MQSAPTLPYITLLLLISFASVNALLFTPAMPDIAVFFSISNSIAQATISWFLVGYAVGQLVYGPLANRYGRKPAIYIGIILQIISSLVCVLSAALHLYWLLVFGRFFMALGSGVGLKMTFTLVNECYEPRIAVQKMSYLTLAFAVTPGISVALGGVLNEYLGWTSCFYACAIYGVLLFYLVKGLPETQLNLNVDALKIRHVWSGYVAQFVNPKVVFAGLLMGGSTSFVYIFAALTPFIAIKLLGMSSSEYGYANILPPIGLILGSLLSAQLSKTTPMHISIRMGILIASAGVLMMFIAMFTHLPVMISIFTTMVLIYFGLSLLMANASTIAMSTTSDKAHASAVMNFINMGFATVVVLLLGLIPVSMLLLPSVYILMCIFMFLIYKQLSNNK